MYLQYSTVQLHTVTTWPWKQETPQDTAECRGTTRTIAGEGTVNHTKRNMQVVHLLKTGNVQVSFQRN